ncbi:FGFR1 oncogene partner isoform X4 [Scyliorhinus canicula]|uniref:FGFR1 oncogene partner isoform X4 n=1 Tax=Scyliorhinus canicula TaxID=7830 RepID=UPI0018F3B194|nr:FGFR1 oncogene partner isoform X4 [Scyliorhinus canicula]
MSAEEDTELRDLLVQTLENSGVLNKIKAELRAAVFLALEEQERVENKTPLVNESLKKFLNTKDGRLVAGLVTEFLQFFNLDFTLAVFQPETNTELTAKHIAEAKKKFEFYDKDKNGEISKEELRELFIDLFPHFHKNMLDRYVNEEFKAVDKDFNQVIDFDEFLGMYKRLFIQCRSVVAPDATDMVQSPRKLSEGRQTTLNTSSKDEEIPRYKGTGKVKENGEKADEKITDNSLGDTGPISGDVKSSSNLSSGEPKQEVMLNTTTNLPELKKDEKLYLDDEDSFFDDPLPEQMKIYGCISAKNSDTDEDAEDPFVEAGGRANPLERRTDLNSKPTSGLTSLSDAPPLTVNLGSLAKAPPLKEADIKGTRDEEEYYDDDFVSGSQRSDKTKSEVSIGEEIEEDISVEGEDLCTDDQLDDFTLDHTISHCSDVADYIEEVAK